MKQLFYLDEEQIPNEIEDEFLCPKCHGTIKYSIVNSKSVIPVFCWFCHSCGDSYDSYELKVVIKEAQNVK